MNKVLLFIFLGFLSLPILAQKADFASLNFKKADAVAKQYKGASLESLPVLSYNLTNTLTTDVEKYRAIYLWVCTNIENDYYAYVKNKSARNRFAKDSLKLAIWNKDFTKKTFKKLLKEKKTICTGYAYLIKELANLADIKCEIIDGYGRIGNDNIGKLSMLNHSWNAVQLNNKWYLCDATWSSGIYDLNTYEFEFDYNDGYFLTDPNLFVKNHYPINTKWILTETIIPITDFLNGSIVYADAFKKDIIPFQPESLEIKAKLNQEIIFLLMEKHPVDIKNINLEVSSGKYKNVSKPIINRTKEGFLEVKHKFENRGTYDFHIKLNDDYLVTYIIKVKKK